MAVAVYIRVSHVTQNLDSQRQEIERWIAGQSYKPEEIRWYEDKESGKTLERPAFARLQRDIWSGEVSTVIVWKLDRIARRIKDGVNVIAEWCEKGVRVVSVTQQIDLSGPAGHLMATLLFGIAEIELQHAKERQSAGIAAAKKRGVYHGRRPGALKHDNGPERAAELRRKGVSVPDIAALLGVARMTVYRYLRSAKAEAVSPSDEPMGPVTDKVKWPR